MPRKLNELSPVDVAVINYLYSLVEPLDFNEYLRIKYHAELDAALLLMLQTRKPVAPASTVLGELLVKALSKWHPNPRSILHPDLAHRAFAGLKGIVVFASEALALHPGSLHKAMAEAAALQKSTEIPVELLLRLLIRHVIFEPEVAGLANPYHAPAVWRPKDALHDEDLPKAQIWAFVQESLWDGIVGISEQMSDVVMRGQYAVAWAGARDR